MALDMFAVDVALSTRKVWRRDKVFDIFTNWSFFLQFLRSDRTYENVAEALSVLCAPRSSHKNETSPNTWRNTNATDFGSTQASTS